ncbi:MAG: glycosyltransferase family 4 protein [Bacteroidaceae bacterium]|nr:glycosyltransferase family 4 protein [Bacteroidaceae bacterium]
MKILLCSPYESVIKENAGGIAVWAKHLMDYHRSIKSDIEVEILPYNRSIYVHEGLSRIVRIYKGAKDYLGLMWKTRRRIKQEHFDVLHLCSSALMSIIRDYFVMRMARKNGIAGVLHFHCGRIPRIAANGGWKWRVLKAAVAEANAVVVLDDDSYRVLVSNGFKNVYKVPNPLSEDLVRSIDAMADNIARVERRILFVGHILPSKGVYELVQACAGIDGIELRLIGRVEDLVKKDLLAIASSKSEEWMHLLGECGHNDVLQEMLSCDIFVFPSYTEGFPNVILEAMACGTPIIASGVGAIPEMLDNGKCGDVIHPQDYKAVKMAIERLLDDEERKSTFSLCSKERVCKEYGISTVWELLQAVWEKN